MVWPWFTETRGDTEPKKFEYLVWYPPLVDEQPSTFPSSSIPGLHEELHQNMELDGAILALRFSPRNEKQKHIDALRSVVRKHCFDIVRRTQHEEARQAEQFATVSGIMDRAGQGDLFDSALDSVKQELLERKLAIDEQTSKVASSNVLSTSTDCESIALTEGTGDNPIHLPGAYPPSETDSAGDSSDNERSLKGSSRETGSFAKERPLKG